MKPLPSRCRLSAETRDAQPGCTHTCKQIEVQKEEVRKTPALLAPCTSRVITYQLPYPYPILFTLTRT